MKAKAKVAAVEAAIVTPDSEEVLTIDQITERYRDEWILLQVTDEADHGRPEAGIIVVRGPTRDSVQVPSIAILRAAEGSDRRYYLFNAFARYRSWDDWRATLDENWRPRRSGGQRKH
ncbi:MAG TPA: hypothetical protein VKV26_02170 [Dehalococcoidia bacterium]|nr:hypothetical protein [Dehalococcoidia bacterium]